MEGDHHWRRYFGRNGRELIFIISFFFFLGVDDLVLCKVVWKTRRTGAGKDFRVYFSVEDRKSTVTVGCGGGVCLRRLKINWRRGRARVVRTVQLPRVLYELTETERRLLTKWSSGARQKKKKKTPVISETGPGVRAVYNITGNNNYHHRRRHARPIFRRRTIATSFGMNRYRGYRVVVFFFFVSNNDNFGEKRQYRPSLE